jgi:hypothetical protein
MEVLAQCSNQNVASDKEILYHLTYLLFVLKYFEDYYSELRRKVLYMAFKYLGEPLV